MVGRRKGGHGDMEDRKMWRTGGHEGQAWAEELTQGMMVSNF